MKIINKSILSLVCASSLYAGEEVKIVVITPPEPAKEAWYVEAAAFGSVAAGDLYESQHPSEVVPEDLQMYGADLTIGYKFDDSNAVQFRLGYSYGDAENSAYFGLMHYRNKVRVHNFSLMPGYRYTCALDDEFSLYAAVHAGLTNTSLKFEDEYIQPGQYSSPARTHASKWGFGYSIEVGVRYDITDSIYAFAAYEFRENEPSPTLNHDVWDRPREAESQSYHLIRIGAGMEF